MKKVNKVVLQSQDFIYIIVGTVINPNDTEPTGTFTYAISDNLGNPVEAVDSGITFSAAAGGFSSLGLVWDVPTINEGDVSYTFFMQP